MEEHALQYERHNLVLRQGRPRPCGFGFSFSTAGRPPTLNFSENNDCRRLTPAPLWAIDNGVAAKPETPARVA